MAPAKKNAGRLRAHLAFLDESGFLMAPLLRRTWAPRGQTPLSYEKGAFRQKVSAIAVLTVSPTRHRVRLYYALYPNENITSEHIVDFLRVLAGHLRNRIVLVWDRLASHKSRRVWNFLTLRSEFHPVFFPAYAPELNPVESVWSYLKGHSLVNLAAKNVQELATRTDRATRRVQREPRLLRSFFRATPLSLRLH